MPNRYLGVKAETVWGTALAPSVFFQLQNEDIHLEHAHEDLRVLSQHSPNTFDVTQEHVEGSARIKGTYEDLGILLEHLLGGVDTTGVGPYTHTSPAATGIPFQRLGTSMTVEVHRDQTTAWRYSGMKVTSLSMEFDQQTAPEFSIGFLGKDESQETPATPTYASPTNAMSVLQMDMQIDAVSTKIFSASVNVDFPVDQVFLVGAKVLAKEPIENGGFAVTGTAEICLDTLTDYDKFVTGTVFQDLSIVVTDATLSLTVNMNKCRLTSFMPTLDERNRVRATVEWQSVFDTLATDAIQTVLINNSATA